MKRYGNLYDTVISLDNLDAAECRARRGKKTRRDVVRFLSDREQNLQRLRQSLLDGTFRTSQYNIFEMCDPKRRTIWLKWCNGKHLYKKLIHTMATSLINKLKKWKRRQKS